jgi:REP element-mobilizing transposase RayT
MAYAYKIHDQQGLYFITCTVHQWVDIFTRKDYADILVESLRFCQKNKGLEIYAWVIMSNHLHLIISCKDGFDLSDVLRDFKKYTASRIVKFISENSQESRRSWLMWLFKPEKDITFWQPDNHAKEINSKDFIMQKMQYIHLDPVRAGIVDREEAWMYSSAKDFNNMRGLLELSHFY